MRRPPRRHRTGARTPTGAAAAAWLALASLALGGADAIARPAAGAQPAQLAQPAAEAPPLGGTLAAHPAPPTVADPLRGLDLWRGAKVGMSMAQVRRQFPGAVATAVPTTLTGGQSDLLELPGLDLDGHPGVAHFYFAGVELVAVELTAGDLQPGRPARNIAAAKAIAQAYSSRYGQGYDCGPKGLGDLDAYECKWLKGRVAIQLWYMDVAGQAPLFYIAYRQADDPSYNL